MRGRWLACRLTCLGVVAALAAVARAAGPTDIARLMPSDTAVYLGWSPWLEKDSAELRTQQKLVEELLAMAAEQSGARDTEWLSVAADMLATVQTAAGGVGLFDLAALDQQFDIQAALVLAAGAESARLGEGLRKLVGMVEALGPIEQHTVKDVALECLALPHTSMRLVWGVHHDCFLLALGDTAAGKVIDCLSGTAPNLAASAEFRFARGKVAAGLDSGHFCIYADVQRGINRVKELVEQARGPLPPIVDQALTELGLGAVRYMYTHYDERDGQPRLTVFAHIDGPMRGLLKLWDQKPLTEDDLKIIPQDAYWAQVSNLDLAGLWEETQRVIDELSPEATAQLQGALALTRMMLGFSITDDLLPAFGDTWAMFDAPDHGGLLLTGTVLVAEVQDAEMVQNALRQLIQMLTPLLMQEDVSLTLKQTQRGEHTIHYVLVGGVPCPVAPAWALVNNRWVFGLFPQTVAVAIKQVDPRTRGASILDHPDVKAARAKLPASVHGFTYFDSKYFVRLFYPILNGVQTAAASMFARHGAEIDLAFMPTLPEQAAKTANFVGIASTDKDGVLYASIGSDAPVLQVIAGGTALSTAALLPSLARAREISKRAVSAANLRGIGQACHIYANDHEGKFPDSFEVLVRDGLITEEMLYSPRDPLEDRVSYVLIRGQTSDSDPRNILAYERIFGDEGTNVLFVDDRVEFLKLAQFKTALRQTYDRLGRTKELPAEFRD